MGCTLDPSYVPYRRFLTQQAAVKFQATGELDAAALAAPTAAGAGGATLYRCRKCRTLLATSDNILDTEAGGKGFSRRKRGKEAAAAARGSSGAASAEAEGAGGIFVEPLRWMADAVGGEIAGKLYCPKQQCTARLGAFSWAGLQNAQGGWITPAFHLHLARLDAEDPSRTAALQEHLSGGGGGIIRPPRLSPPPPPRSHFTHLVLDCDGVMVDSERPSCEALRRAILKITGGFDIPHEFPIDFRPVFGMDVHSCIEYYSHRFSTEYAWPEDLESLSKAVSDAKEPIYRDLTSAAGAIVAFPGTAPLVAAARARGMGVAVASSGSPDKIAHNLESSGLAGLVPQELIVSAKHVARGKPAPDVYIEALRRLGCVDARRAVVVEDAVNGLKAAAAAGCFTVAVTTSLPAEDLKPYADVVVERLEDVDFEQLEAMAAGKAAEAVAGQMADGLKI
jgi:HAD superfamily hydrolase (TIGR01509 family)